MHLRPESAVMSWSLLAPERSSSIAKAAVSMRRPRLVPSSTYRLQLHGGFPLSAASSVVPYLQRLGIGAAYTSPYFAAAPGSTHGYDVTNHNEINPELGGEPAPTGVTDAVRAAGPQRR